MAKHMSADTIGQTMMDGPHIQVDGFKAAERAFDVAELFVTAHDLRSSHGISRDIRKITSRVADT